MDKTKDERIEEERFSPSVVQKKPSLKINLFLNIIYEALTVIIPLFTAPYISRVFGSDGIGVYSYTHSLVTYFILFSTLGVGLYGVKKIASFRDNRQEYSKCFWEIEIVVAFSTTICFLLWMVLSICYVQYRVYLLIFSFLVINCMLDIGWFYKGLERFQYTVIINIIIKITVLVLIFVLIKSKGDLWLYILISSLSIFLGSLSMWLFLPKFLVKTRINSRDVLKHFKETIIYFAPSIAATVYTVLDKTLIGLITHDESQNGYYEQATKIITICKSLCFVAINGVMTSRMSYYYSVGNAEQIKSGVDKTMHVTMFLSIGACFGLIGVSAIFVPLFFGDEFYYTIKLLYILAPIIPIICLSGVLGSLVYTPSGNIKKATLFMIIGSLVNLLLNIPLILFYNYIGAAIASVCAEAIISFLFFVFAKATYSLKDLVNSIWKKLISGSLMLALILVLNWLLAAYLKPIFLTLLDVAAGFIFYLFVLVILKDESVSIVVNSLIKKNTRRRS